MRSATCFDPSTTSLIVNMDILDRLTSLFTEFSALAKSNPLLATIIGAWGLTIVTIVFRNIPARIISFIYRQSTTSLALNNTHTGSNYETFIGLMEWFKNSHWSKWSRSYMLDGVWKDNGAQTVVGVGLGGHFFLYKRRLFWMTRSQLQNTGTSYQPQYQIHLTMLGRNRKVLMRLVEEFKWTPEKSEPHIYHFKGGIDAGGWQRSSKLVPRDLSSVIVTDNVKEEIMIAFEKWRESKDWYYHRGLPWKLTMMFEGPTGTGKTSLIRALAAHYNMNVAIIQLNEMSDRSFQQALNDVPPNSFLVMEDFDDAVKGLHRTEYRDGVKKEEEKRRKKSENDKRSKPAPAPTEERAPEKLQLSLLTLSGLLNALDGLVVLDGQVIIMSTNVVEDMDPALIRPGRIDRRFHLGWLKDSDVREYIRVMFPEVTWTVEDEFDDISGSALMQLFVRNSHDFDGFIQSIPRKQPDFTSTLSP